MCTITLVPTEEGLLITMNRDEVKSRQEDGLKYSQHEDLQLIYPMDAQAGGTWIGMNNHGVVMALLNRYQASFVDSAKSRGHIIPNALQCGNIDAVLTHMKYFDATQYNGFDCLLASHNQVVQFSWDGLKYYWREKKINNGIMVTSSSEHFLQVKNYRATLFNRWLKDNYVSYGKNYSPFSIDYFHLRQDESMTHRAVFMQRELSHTKSLVQINLTTTLCRLDYFDRNILQPNTSLDQLDVTASLEMTALSYDVSQPLSSRLLKNPKNETIPASYLG